MLLLRALSSAIRRRSFAKIGLLITIWGIHVSERVSSGLGNAVVVGRAAVAALLATSAVAATTARTCARSLLSCNVRRTRSRRITRRRLAAVMGLRRALALLDGHGGSLS